MLKLSDLQEFKQFLDSGGWAEAFAHAEHELRLEMLEKIEELLEAAEVADRVVGHILFSQEGMTPVGEASSPLKKE
jgi:hypothetical protein